MLYLHHRERNTKVLGPGTRYAIWVQGCKRRCAGCINPEGQPLDENGYWLSEENLLQEILSTKGIRGITISGGEPFLQAEALNNLLEAIKKMTDLDVMVYTGYTLAALRKTRQESVQKMLKNIDILIDGEYIEEQNNNSLYRGSDNQQIHLLTEKYKKFKQYFNNTKNRDIEFVCHNNEDLFMVGIPPKNFQKDFWQKIGEHKREEEMSL